VEAQWLSSRSAVNVDLSCPTLGSPMTGYFGERRRYREPAHRRRSRLKPLIVRGSQTRKNSVLADDGYEHSFRTSLSYWT
jgi:hypothetical protein